MIDGNHDTVQRVRTIDDENGIFIAGSDNLVNDSVQRGGGNGVHISPSFSGVGPKNNTISHDDASRARIDGIALYQGGGNAVTRSTSTDNGAAGIRMFRHFSWRPDP
jgi:Right handed beta helix region